MAALSSGETANGKSWCGWDLEQIKHFKHWRGWPGLARSQSGGLWRTGPGGCTARRGRLLLNQVSPARPPLEASLRSHRARPRSPLEETSRKLVRCVVNELFFLEQPSGRRRLTCMPMSDEQIKEQISYLETRIERQRAIIDGLEAEGYGGEVIRRSRVLLKQMIADLDQLLLQLREARQINVIKAEQKISSSASDASSQNSIDR